MDTRTFLARTSSGPGAPHRKRKPVTAENSDLPTEYIQPDVPARRPSRRASATAGLVGTGRVVVSLFSVLVLLGCGYGYVNLRSLQNQLATTDVISSDG